MTPPAVELRDVNAGYSGVEVLHDLSLRVEPYTVVAILGPNGAGKTTLLRVLTGLVRPTKGQVIINGTDLTGLPSHTFSSRGVCHVPEGRGIFPSLTVRENLRVFAPKSRDDDAFRDAIDAFPPLARYADKAAGLLSGGEQQMLALARAWIVEPSLVVVDEPTLGLAPIVVEAVYTFLERLCSLNCTVILVEQYLEMALAIATQAHVLVNGRIVESGPADSISRHTLQKFYIS